MSATKDKEDYIYIKDNVKYYRYLCNACGKIFIASEESNPQSCGCMVDPLHRGETKKPKNKKVKSSYQPPVWTGWCCGI